MPVKMTIGREYAAKTGEIVRCRGWSLSGLFWCTMVGKQKFADGTTQRPYDESGHFRGERDVVWPDLVRELDRRLPPNIVEEPAFPIRGEKL